MPHKDGIERVTSFIKKNGASKDEIELCEIFLKHILQKNYFEFNNTLYLQTSGTAMGTRCAPNYDIIFMAEIEEEFLQSQTKVPRIWLRFIDDIFMVWNHTRQELDIFTTDLNKFHPTIKSNFLPENIKELVPVSSPLPDLDLQTEPQLLLEEFI